MFCFAWELYHKNLFMSRIKLEKNINMEYNFELPESLETIGIGAFAQCYLESIVIPAKVKHIGWSAFSSCTNLSSVTFSEGLVSIRGNAFSSCESIKQISLPSTLKYIGEEAFEHTELEAVSVPEGVVYVGEGAFES